MNKQKQLKLQKIKEKRAKKEKSREGKNKKLPLIDLKLKLKRTIETPYGQVELQDGVMSADDMRAIDWIKKVYEEGRVDEVFKQKLDKGQNINQEQPK